MAKTINYYDKDDIKEAIREVLTQKNKSSDEKFDLLRRLLIDNAPVDEKFYIKALEILRVNIFSRDKYAKTLDDHNQKRIYRTLIAYHISKLLINKVDITYVLKEYIKQANRYKLTEIDINGWILTAAKGEILTYLEGRITRHAKIQAINSNGKSFIEQHNIRYESQTRDMKHLIDNKINNLSDNISNKILYLMENKKLQVNELPHLSKMGIDEKKVLSLDENISNLIDSLSIISLFANSEVRLDELETKIDDVINIIGNLVKSKEKGLSDILKEVAFAFVVSGIAVGAVGALASIGLKKIKVGPDKYKLTANYDFDFLAYVPKWDKIPATKFWETIYGQISNEGIKDGIKQGIRQVMNEMRNKKNDEKNLKPPDKFPKKFSKLFPVLIRLSTDIEQYYELIRALAYMGFMNNSELDVCIKNIFGIKKILETLESKWTYIEILKNEVLYYPLLNNIGKKIIYFDSFDSDIDEVKDIRKKRISWHNNIDDIASFNNNLYNFLKNEDIIGLDKTGWEYARHRFYFNPTYEMPFSHWDCLKFMFGEYKLHERLLHSDLEITFCTMEVKVFPLIQDDIGIFLESKIYIENIHRNKYGVKGLKIGYEVVTNRLFIGFAPHLSGWRFIEEPNPAVSVFYNKKLSIDLKPQYQKQKELLQKIAS